MPALAVSPIRKGNSLTHPGDTRRRKPIKGRKQACGRKKSASNTSLLQEKIGH